MPLALLAATAVAALLPAQDSIPARGDYVAVARLLDSATSGAMRDKGIPALSIALVDGREVVWARGFGWATHPPSAGVRRDSIPATAETVYHVGSVSELFTDLAAMHLVGERRLDVAAPVTRYLPEFRPRDPRGGMITLRELMTHRAGLARTPPAGSDADSTTPTLAATVASLNRTALVYPPGTRTKYSPAGVAVLGRVIERVTGEPFAAYVERAVLVPLGMTGSGFGNESRNRKGNERAPDGPLRTNLADGTMWTYQGRTFPAPDRPLGAAPAAGLDAPVTDLARVATALFAGGRGVIAPAMFDSLLAPTPPRAADAPHSETGYTPGMLDGRRVIGRDGTAPGVATTLLLLPDDQLAAVVVATLDAATGVTTDLARTALRAMLAARAGVPLPRAPATSPVGDARARRLAGRYGHGAKGVDLLELEGRLYLLPHAGGARVELHALGGDTLVTDDPLSVGTIYLVTERTLIAGADTLTRVPVREPTPAPATWRGLIGEYGPDSQVVYVLERDGALNALTGWFVYNPLTEVSPNVFRFPAAGPYDGETLTFTRDRTGRATRATLSGRVLPRRAIGPEPGKTQLTIRPAHPIEELRRAALAAAPPHETGDFRPVDLVELTALDPTIRLDVRYATTHNFLGARFYSEPRAFLQRPAAEAVARVHRALRLHGYGLLVHDAYRPWYVTKMFWDATPPEHRWLVADPASGSRHNRGAAVDLTLYELATGKEVEMPGTYDELSDRSLPMYPGGTSLQRWHREFLRHAMEAEGFTVYPQEWWHFDYEDWRHYPIGNVPFERLVTGR
jgi:D-alanyl-D-alanine dipeptidase/CubicO group peptidase (beta-lactamase class C family)